MPLSAHRDFESALAFAAVVAGPLCRLFPYHGLKRLNGFRRQMIWSFSTSYAVFLAVLPAGADPDGEIGEAHDPETYLRPITLEAIQGKRDRVNVFGTDYDTRDGTCVRDYIHVVDIAKAHVIAIERMIEQKSEEHFEIFNLGTGNGMTVLEVINAFEKYCGLKLNYHLGERRAGDVEKVYADTTKANKVLGWKATHDLKSMITSAWEWEKKLNTKNVSV